MFRSLLAVLVLCSSAFATDPLVLTYQGATKMPADPTGGTFGGSIGPFAYDSTTGNLLVVGNVIQQTSCVIKPGALKLTQSRDTSILNKSTLVSPWSDPSLGMRATLAAEVPTINQWRISGATYAAGKLYLVVYRYYNVAGTSYRGLMINDAGVLKGAWYVGDFHSLATNYYLATDSDGAIYSGSTFAYATSNSGPASYKIDLDQSLADGAHQPATALLTFPFASPLVWTWPAEHTTGTPPFWHYLPQGSGTPQDRIYNGSWTITGHAVLDATDGTKLLVYAVSRPHGDWYGTSPVVDAVSKTELSPLQGNAQGYNKESQTTSLYVFPNAVATNGADKTYYELVIRQKLIRDAGECLLSADHANRKLWVMETAGDWQTTGPILHQWKY